MSATPTLMDKNITVSALFQQVEKAVAELPLQFVGRPLTRRLIDEEVEPLLRRYLQELTNSGALMPGRTTVFINRSSNELKRGACQIRLSIWHQPDPVTFGLEIALSPSESPGYEVFGDDYPGFAALLPEVREAVAATLPWFAGQMLSRRLIDQELEPLLRRRLQEVTDRGVLTPGGTSVSINRSPEKSGRAVCQVELAYQPKAKALALNMEIAWPPAEPPGSEVVREVEDTVAALLRSVAGKPLTRSLIDEELEPPLKRYLGDLVDRDVVRQYCCAFDRDKASLSQGILRLELSVLPRESFDRFSVHIEVPWVGDGAATSGDNA